MGEEKSKTRKGEQFAALSVHGNKYSLLLFLLLPSHLSAKVELTEQEEEGKEEEEPAGKDG